MNLLSWAGIAFSVFLSLFCISSLAAAAVSFSLLSLIFVSYIPKTKLAKHLRRIPKEDVVCHAEGQPQGLGSTGEGEVVAAATASKPNWLSPAIDEQAGSNIANGEPTPDRTSEISTNGSDSEEWGSLSSYSSDEDEEDAARLIEIGPPFHEGDHIEIGPPFHEGDHIGLHEQVGHKEDDALNDNEEDSMIELDISAGFIQTTRENEQSIRI